MSFFLYCRKVRRGIRGRWGLRRSLVRSDSFADFADRLDFERFLERIGRLRRRNGGRRERGEGYY